MIEIKLRRWEVNKITWREVDLMDAIPLRDIIRAYTDIYVNTQQIFV